MALLFGGGSQLLLKIRTDRQQVPPKTHMPGLLRPVLGDVFQVSASMG
ncbi:hypothetical protein APY04_1687 [Hyphomicrobium sulfonivorans]|uniref:Uncharacterized protein n=1 Tax=Hyphomicrobium sulfonivorans TaxID=121290 RepID=A0A109BHV7_HYPSL|nr:hypothetical protein [Hyphomicrobium sulfonivorans]KWT69081.1 hypothetical protein APY04_1687 [Hyphomicrobium sulfonivorans]